MSPVLQEFVRVEEALEGKVETPLPLLKVLDEESQASTSSREINEPKERNLEFLIEKAKFKFIGEHIPFITKETKILVSLCKKYFAFLNP